jgi:hypothetical protein
MGGGASKQLEPTFSPELQRPAPPPPSEMIRPHGKKILIKKGCDCEWCEAVSWELVGTLRDTIEKLQQSLMMREVDRAELEALLQVKIEVSTDLREKLKRSTEDIQTLNRQINKQQEQIANLELRQELHDSPAEMTQLELEELLRWKATVLGALASAGEAGDVPIDDATVITERLSNYERVKSACDEAEAQNKDLEAEVASTRLQLENANQEIGRLKKLFAPKKKFNIDTEHTVRGLPGRGATFPSRAGPTPDQLTIEDEASQIPRAARSREVDEEQLTKAAELAALKLAKDEKLLAEDPVAYETKKRLEARMSIDARLAGI